MCVCVCVCVCDAPNISIKAQTAYVLDTISETINHVCLCVCDAQIFQIMLKLRGSTMMRRNNQFFCPSALSPGFTNCVEMTRNMQQEGVGLVLLPRPASLVRSPVLPCVEAPLGESVVPLADAGGEKPTGAAGAHVLGGGERGGVATGSTCPACLR